MTARAPRRSLTTLLPEVRACRICEADLPLGPRPIVQLSPRTAILIVGQAPGRRVHESGIPFADPSGDRLREWLGVDRDTFYDARRIGILPMGFCYPGTGRNGDLPPRPECAPAWRQPLMASLRHVKLTVVLGQYAQAYHLDPVPKSVTEAVKAWETFWPTHIPLPHPSPRNQRWFRANPWFAKRVLPTLRARVSELLDVSAPGEMGR